MGKLAIFVYITIALLLLLLLSHSPTKPRNHRHRRLKIRSSFNFTSNPINHHEAVAFDPIVAEIERRREDKLWERQFMDHAQPEILHAFDSAPGAESQPDLEDFMMEEDDLNNEDKFNVNSRLTLLFPKIDVDPTDGFVSENELTEWNLNQTFSDVLHRTQREMDVHDKNRDGFISFHEYEPPSWVHNSTVGSVGYEMGWWKEEHFNASDVDGDGLLNMTEFIDFLHPADSKNPNLQHWLCDEEIRERDSDKDGKISFKEFFHGLFDTVRNYDEESHDSSDDTNDAPAKVLFRQLDKDRDGYLSSVELMPVIGKIHPSERYYANQQATYMISQADTDKDGRLTLAEMIENPYVFYGAVFNDDEDDFDEHEELR